MSKQKLIEHRKALSLNPSAYSREILDGNITRLVKSIVPHIKAAGVSVSPSRNFNKLTQVIRLLFDVQDNRPFFHVEGTELPLCWNSPRDWDKNYIKYEWGHLRSLNQDEDKAHNLENLGLYSARCNQHIQTSMHKEELLVYGGILAQKISNVLTARRKLFVSKEWIQLIQKLQ